MPCPRVALITGSGKRRVGWSVAEAGVADSVPEVWSRATGGERAIRPRMTVVPQGGGR